jgi:hypothetical protein
LHSRREFLTLSATASVAPLSACSGNEMDDYNEAAAGIRNGLSDNPDVKAFVRFATLAANGHNTQPWRFAIRESGVSPARLLAPNPGRGPG